MKLKRVSNHLTFRLIGKPNLPMFAEKREDRRKEINRPKKKIEFGLQNNTVKEFHSGDIVQSDEHAPTIKSSERNFPCTTSRLVKLDLA